MESENWKYFTGVRDKIWRGRCPPTPVLAPSIPGGCANGPDTPLSHRRKPADIASCQQISGILPYGSDAQGPYPTRSRRSTGRDPPVRFGWDALVVARLGAASRA